MTNSLAVSRPQLSDEVASYLRQAIMAGELVSGQSVRADALGELLSVSATPVREALHSLRAEGFLELVPRKGFTVARIVAQDIRDIFEVHALIAGELAARAATQATKEQIAELGAIHHELMAAAYRGDNEALEEKNHLFHQQVYRTSDSRRIHWALSIFTKYVPRRFYAEIEGWPMTTAADHSAVIDGISRHDPDSARSAMADHVRNAGELLASHFERRALDHR